MAYGPILAVFLALAGIFKPMAEAANADAGMRLLRAAASGDLQEIRRLLAAGGAPNEDKAARRFSSLSTRTMSRSRRRSSRQARA
jgi:hypothetical protein